MALGWWALAGCTYVQGLLPVPDCEDHVEVDPATGVAELVLDPAECYRDDLAPDRVDYWLLVQDDGETPLTDPAASPCNTASAPLLGVELESLVVDPADYEEFASFVAGAWTSVRFSDSEAGGSSDDWYVLFRFGAEEVVTGAECDAYWDAVRGE